MKSCYFVISILSYLALATLGRASDLQLNIQHNGASTLYDYGEGDTRAILTGKAAWALYRFLEKPSIRDVEAEKDYRNPELNIFTKYLDRFKCSHYQDKRANTHHYQCVLNIASGTDSSILIPLLVPHHKALGSGTAQAEVRLGDQGQRLMAFSFSSGSAESLYKLMKQPALRVPEIEAAKRAYNLQVFQKTGPELVCNQFSHWEKGSVFTCWVLISPSGVIFKVQQP